MVAAIVGSLGGWFVGFDSVDLESDKGECDCIDSVRPRRMTEFKLLLRDEVLQISKVEECLDL